MTTSPIILTPRQCAVGIPLFSCARSAYTSLPVTLSAASAVRLMMLRALIFFRQKTIFISRQCVKILHLQSLGQYFQTVICLFDGFRSIGIHQCTGRRHENALGKHLVHIEAGFFQFPPKTFNVTAEAFHGFLDPFILIRRNQAPTEHTASIHESLDAVPVFDEYLSAIVGIERKDVDIEIEQKIPVGIAAKVDAPGMFDLSKEAFQINARHLSRIAGKTAEDSLQPWFIDKKECLGI